MAGPDARGPAGHRGTFDCPSPSGHAQTAARAGRPALAADTPYGTCRIHGDTPTRGRAARPDRPAGTRRTHCCCNSTSNRITARDLAPPSSIKTAEDLDTWLTELRERLQVLLSEYSEIRFES